MLSVFLCHLNWIVPPLWKSLTEHQKCQDQQPQNRLQKKAALLSAYDNDAGLKALMQPYYDRTLPFITEQIGTLSGRFPQVATRYITYPRIIKKQSTSVIFRSFFSDIIHPPFIAK